MLMNSVKYEKAVKEGERVDWYGVMVPEELITESVLVWSNSLVDEINKLESELIDIRGASLDKRKAYIKSLQKNLQNAPYCLNGDFYLKKKERFEAEIEELNKMVLSFCIQQVYSEAQGYMKYIDDASTLVVPIAHPVMADNSDRELTLKPWF